MNRDFIWKFVVEMILGYTSIKAPEEVKERIAQIVDDIVTSQDISDDTILQLQKDIDDVLREYGLIRRLETQ